MKKVKRLFESAVVRLIVIVLAVLIPLNVLTLIFAGTAVTQVERQVSTETQNALTIYLNQLDDTMTRVITKMYMVARGDVDFSRLNVKDVDSEEEYYRQLQSYVNLNISLNHVIEDNQEMDGVFAYFPRKSMFVFGGNQQQAETKNIENYVLDGLKTSGIGIKHSWRLVVLDGTPVLIFVDCYLQGYYGGWIDLNRLARDMGFFSRDNSVVQAFTDPKGQVYCASVPDINAVDMDKDHQNYHGESCTLVKAESQRSNLCYVQIMPKSEINSALPEAIRVLYILAFAALVVIPVIIIAMYKWIIKPMGKLTDAMEHIEQGDMDFRIEPDGAGSEFETINRNFNRMMDQVSDLKISVYEERIKAEKIKLGFLSQQIRPHFILNTLNILYSYEKEEHHLIQKMILCLSRYFRYVVNSNTDFVELGEELNHIRNYFEIQQIRFTKTFRANVEYDEELLDCLVPPLIIQSFAENAVKHSLTPGEIIDITVSAHAAGERVIITIEDNGVGIPRFALDKIEEYRRSGDFQHELGVGIQNSIDRLRILYGSDASLTVEQTQPHGTRIVIDVPIKRKGMTEDEYYLG